MQQERWHRNRSDEPWFRNQFGNLSEYSTSSEESAKAANTKQRDELLKSTLARLKEISEWESSGASIS